MIQAQVEGLLSQEVVTKTTEVRNVVGMLLTILHQNFSSTGDLFCTFYEPDLEVNNHWLGCSFYEQAAGKYQIRIDIGISNKRDDMVDVSPWDTNTVIECEWNDNSGQYVENLTLLYENKQSQEHTSPLILKSDCQRIYEALRHSLVGRKLNINVGY